jgi:hypothetical protein
LIIDSLGRFLPTFVGLIFTLGIFYIFFDLREEREWKAVSWRVKKRIGTHLQTVFTNLVVLCEVESVLTNEQSEEDWKQLSKRQLDDLASKDIKLTDTWKGIIDGLPSYLKTLESRLGEIEGRYGKFLGSKIQISLMDTEEYLHRLSFELEFSLGKEKEREMRISELVQRTMKEIAKLRESGINIGF